MLLKYMVFVALLVGGIGMYGQQQAPTKPTDAVRFAPAPEPTKPWYLRTEVDALVIAGIGVLITSVISLLTLRAIERQANLTADEVKVAKDAADAAMKSAGVAEAQTKAMTDRERARLYVDTPPTPLTGTVRTQSNIFGFQLVVRNVAPTAAINMKGVYSALCVETQTEPRAARTFTLEVTEVIAGNGNAHAPIHVYPSATLITDLKAPALFWCHIWGHIEYNDVLTEVVHYTPFRFCAEVKQIKGDGTAVIDGRWFKCGLDADNKAT